MTNGKRLPLLLFGAPILVQKTPGQGRGPKLNPRSRSQVSNYLGPKFERLQQAMEAERIRIQDTALNLEPEMALVIELATEIRNFAAAAERIGMEWLAEDEIELEPTDELHRVTDKGSRSSGFIQGRLFLTMTDRRALDEFLSRWRRWQDEPDALWLPREKVWRDLFPLIYDIRPWGVEDRLHETGLLEDLRERISAEDEVVPFEAELWYRRSAERRAEVESEVSRLIARQGGRVLRRFQLAEIRYHTLVGEIPLQAASRLLERNHDIELLRCNHVWFFRPVGQCSSPVPAAVEETGMAPSVPAAPDSTLPPVVALFDGVPLQKHVLLDGRLIVDDPDNFESDTPARYRFHGTSMASLIIHGEGDATEPPLRRPLYCRPVMKAQVWAGRSMEGIPENMLPVDLIHRAVRRLFEGEGETAAQAPEIRIINLSIGDRARYFDQSLSPWARLLDWLSFHYNVLFVVSAGNHTDFLDLDIPKADWAAADGDAREASVLRALRSQLRHRRLRSPAESINALTVGAAHNDACPHGPRAAYHIDPFLTRSLSSPISAMGLGFRRSVKPDILMPGGRQIFQDVPGTGEPNVRLEVLQDYWRPGQQTAAPSTDPGKLNETLYFRGTSNAAALATRLGAQLFEVLEGFRVGLDRQRLEPRYDAVLLKALLVHGSRWSEAGERLRSLFASEVGGRKIKEFISRFLGYGVVDPDRVLFCTEQRATLLGFGTLRNGEAHSFDLPLPPALSGVRGLRRLTLTLAWFTPTAPGHQRYRQAHLWFESDAKDLIGVGRDNLAYNHQTVSRGTVQHETFAGEEARAFADGDSLRVQVNCREDAPGLDEPIDYGLVASFEVGDEIQIPLYQEIEQRVRPEVRVRPR